ncbi:hypothetical protein ACQUW0_26965, partial [Ralstonia pseudosolanacearum]|uniref:hypothetical protein n=1 Tax=Ralstonia pseudosolanacearum TaxID=1310165 RepID=UPI003D16552A
HSYLDCVCRKPKFDVTTLSASPRIDTQKLEVIANRDIFGTGKYQKSVKASDNSTIYNNWFSQLY